MASLVAASKLMSVPSATKSQRALLATLASACLLALLPATRAEYSGGWHAGRATHYGGKDDGWNIHEGSCGYGWLDQDKSTGWDIAAMSDKNFDYGGSCGRCFEVRCNPANLKDGYGQYFDRAGICRDTEASVVVQITDTCPCYYPTNAYSNKRWCCGDMYHLDMSVFSFEKLGDPKFGVMSILVRPVACSYQPKKRAGVPSSGQSAPNTKHYRPYGWSDKRPWN